MNQDQVSDTIAQHNEIHLQDYLIENAHNLSLLRQD